VPEVTLKLTVGASGPLRSALELLTHATLSYKLMVTLPILGVLFYDLVVFLRGLSRFGQSQQQRERVLLSALFFCSGMPALIYQIVWQRALFSIYGVNAESVAVIVSAFMLGLGLGSLLGGWASARFPRHAVLLFGASELGVAVFGLISLKLFHWAAGFTAGASLPSTILFGFLLLIFPTVLMGATLPLLVQHLVTGSGRVGSSVALLYFANTFGSAVACYLCAIFLLRQFGQSGSAVIAACLNGVVGLSALFLLRARPAQAEPPPAGAQEISRSEARLPLRLVMLLAGISGFIALGFEIAWFRVFELASKDRAPAFALLLSTFLAGVAAGSYIAEKHTKEKSSDEILRIVGFILLVVGALSVFLPPLVAVFQWKGLALLQWAPIVAQLQWRGMWFLLAAPAFFVVAALIGSVLPLLCQLGVAAGSRAGSEVSWTYASNILGSTLGSLFIGFVWMHHFGLQQVSEHLALAAIATGTFVLFLGPAKSRIKLRWALPLAAACVMVFAVASVCYRGLFEKLIFGAGAQVRGPFAHVIENRNGVIAIGRDATVYGNGVYDGAFNTDPRDDVNFVVRAYAVSLFHPAPKRILMVGLASGSWAQIFANHPDLESLDVVEINPGYLSLISQYPAVASLLRNPRVHINVDDGRRWLLAHPDSRYDVIVINTSFYWRDHSSVLLSADFLKIIRPHLNQGGVYFYNTTGSDDVVATGLRVFPYGLRVFSFLAVSDSPIDFNEDRWMAILRRYTIDGRPVFDPPDPKSEETLRSYAALAAALDASKEFHSFETSKSLNARLGERLIITDNNMGWEWKNSQMTP
jgi:spermidine synthase